MTFSHQMVRLFLLNNYTVGLPFLKTNPTTNKLYYEVGFATNNPNKLKEIQAAVPESITILGLDAIGCHEDIPKIRTP